VQWLWLNTRTSIRLGWQDTWQIQGSRAMTGLQVNAIALIVASVATHRPGALWTIFAVSGRGQPKLGAQEVAKR
jgi:hypothetical protein